MFNRVERPERSGREVSGHSVRGAPPGNRSSASGYGSREGDRGVAVLVDDRYSEPKYRALFPAHWKGVQYTAEPRSLAEIVRRFWKNQDDCE